MRETDEILRDTLADGRWDLAARPDFMANVHRRVRRTKRRRGAAIVTAVVMATAVTIGIVRVPGAARQPVVSPKPSAKVTAFPGMAGPLGDDGAESLTASAFYMVDDSSGKGRIYRLDRRTHQRTVSPTLYRPGVSSGATILPTQNALWVYVTEGAAPDRIERRAILRLDATTLKIRERLTPPAAWDHMYLTAAGGAFWGLVPDTGVVRITPDRVGASGTTTPTGCRAADADFFGADNVAGVLWVRCGATGNRANVMALDTRTGGIRGQRGIDGLKSRQDEGSEDQTTIAGDGAGLWIRLAGGEMHHLAASPGLPDLPVNGIPPALGGYLGENPGAVVVGTRVFVPDGTPTTDQIRCFDTRTGAELATYSGDDSAIVSDGHELFTVRHDELFSYTGPDRCLS
jgi:hypothetical protein